MGVHSLRPSTQSTRRETLRQHAHREVGRLEVLLMLWMHEVTTKSDFAREQADVVADLASEGYITSQLFPHSDTHSRTWKLKPSGADLLWDLAGKYKDHLESHALKQVEGRQPS